ncbi:uncharacterized protein [Spinacia oleracea]|uniref:3'-5' exonuclease domain-containing protein n=1 Tax=Spinacia oleracea TaxID=3562 RepID=A0A9R0HZR7_SPIOL|nr:uncharacterized protein LOC110779712 [Spinacia oleracea]
MMHKVSVQNREVTTTVVNTIPQLDKSLRKLPITSKPPGLKYVVGIDIEKHYTRGIGDNQVAEKVAIVKLCFGNSCLIIQLLHMKEPPCSLAKFLQLQELSFVSVGIKRCVEALNRDYGINMY